MKSVVSRNRKRNIVLVRYQGNEGREKGARSEMHRPRPHHKRLSRPEWGFVSYYNCTGKPFPDFK